MENENHIYMTARFDANHEYYDPDVFVHIWKAGPRWYVKTWGSPRNFDGKCDPYFLRRWGCDRANAIGMAVNLLFGWKMGAVEYSETRKPTGWIEFLDRRG
ncbi:hypothetical protein [Bifidobacterium felsineum]|uniref:hypothetical protein n=1 Tax=Bifidobacterium felsineum TaxID=2045440 RepID=UPI001BDC12E6|nr:hypothetical protein [Bifidobacterium felsineum]MBT1164633.1 hypothetical protein [Bifidobacterium felsineum]